MAKNAPRIVPVILAGGSGSRLWPLSRQLLPKQFLALAGKRTIANLTTFDVILMLIISETTQQAMVRDNNTFTNAALLVITLVVVDIGMSMLKLRFEKLERLLEGEPLVVVENGTPLLDKMQMARIDVEDVLSVARLSRGIYRMEDIHLAVLESSGGISVMPRPPQFPSQFQSQLQSQPPTRVDQIGSSG